MQTPSQTVPLLIIDDDPTITLILKRLLGPHGYALEGRETEGDGLEALCDPHAAWQGVIVDATLPLMQQGRLLKAIRELQPDLPIVVTSALDLPAVKMLVSRNLPVFLGKPFGIQEVLAALLAAGVTVPPPAEHAV